MTRQLENLFVSLDKKAAASGEIEGYASRFGEVDQGGDTVQPGAYAKSLKSMAADDRRVKMLWQHNPDLPIGVWDEVREDDTGLWVKGRVLTDLAKGREVVTLLKQGAIDGLSIGYRTISAKTNSDGTRTLAELELWEVSLVTFPMQSTARVTSVKAFEDFQAGRTATLKRDVEDYLRDAGFSITEAKAGASALAGKIVAMRDAGPGLEQLAAALKARAVL
jgi:uncharacterized protein